MGLLDKVDNMDDAKPAKAKPKAAKAVAKATPKATPKAAKAVAKKATPKAAKPAAKSIKLSDDGGEKPEKIRPTGLPNGFELAGNMPRYIGWIINFAWNFGVAIGLLSILSTGADSDLTIGWAVAGLMILINWLVLPIWTGRNIGEFVSRTKYINSSGSKPIFLHAVLNNSIGFLSLIGLILMMANFQDIGTTGMVPFITGVVFIVFWIFNFFLKKNSDFSQGVFDLAFSSYLVKHVATGDETGWMARFESLGDFGDKWAERSANREDKQKAKAAKKAAKAVAKKESEDDSSDSEEATESEDESSED